MITTTEGRVAAGLPCAHVTAVELCLRTRVTSERLYKAARTGATARTSVVPVHPGYFAAWLAAVARIPKAASLVFPNVHRASEDKEPFVPPLEDFELAWRDQPEPAPAIKEPSKTTAWLSATAALLVLGCMMYLIYLRPPGPFSTPTVGIEWWNKAPLKLLDDKQIDYRIWSQPGEARVMVVKQEDADRVVDLLVNDCLTHHYWLIVRYGPHNGTIYNKVDPRYTAHPLERPVLPR